MILRQLEDPGEQPNPGAAAGALRKWIRWLRRAEDISLSLPGLTKLTKKVLSQNAELAFRTSLVRAEHQTVRIFSEHMLAELDQWVHTEKKGKQVTVAQAYVQQQPSKPTPTPPGGATSEEKPKKVTKECKSFHTVGSCKRGGGCTFAHTLEPGERRCHCCAKAPPAGIFNQSPEGCRGSEAHQAREDPGAGDQGCAAEGS